MRPGRGGRAAMLASLPLVAFGMSATAESPPLPSASLTTASGSAPKLDPGTFRTTLPADSNKRFAQVARSAHETVTVSATGRPRPTDGGWLRHDQELDIALVAPGDHECASASASLNADDPPQPMVATAVLDGSKTKRSSYISDDCKDATLLQVQVTRTDAGGSSRAMPATILVNREPATSGERNPAATKSELAPLTAPSLKTTGEVSGGQGFADAATLATGSVRTDLKLGTTAFYRVRVGWGQRLAVSMEAPRNGSSFASPYDADTTVTLYSPQRLPAGSTYGGDLSHNASIRKDDGEPRRSGAYTAPVRWANRDASSPDFSSIGTDAYRASSVAGWYYVVVDTEPGSNDGPTRSDTPIPARLNVQVTGTAGSGPHYVSANGQAIEAPAAGQMSVGGDHGSWLWGRVAGGAGAVLLAGAACLWALRARRG